MAAYCKCNICKVSPAQPAPGSANTSPETVSGKLVQLAADDILVHWSSRRFARMMSTEVANIELRGVNPKAVCASFYLYRGRRNNPPDRRPSQLRMLGLGGDQRYIVGVDATRDSLVAASVKTTSIYLKSADENISDPEVVLVLGCGGYIDFSGENATRVIRQEVGAEYQYTG